ncbi:alpha-(1,3)-fucosyltransferase C-like [Penaeus chinensis]|uniref:alpha-(1,3)-fucosyltransferase C-like n=1 Tax=Penaeus chinensis TaxID=139456 RepID=UPI001FB63324|nr:alpha-(1,3)-fucosyltransferase C-like [Penaeus chinensis]
MAASARKVILAVTFCLGMVAEISLHASRGITWSTPRYAKAPRPTQLLTHQQPLLDANPTKHDVNITLQEEIPDDLKAEPAHGEDTTSLKKILVWNDMYGKFHYGFGLGREPFVRAGCRVDGCFVTADRRRFSAGELDALVWHFRSSDLSLPEVRSPHTRYVFRMQESPAYLYSSVQPYNGLFNWTFTYRLDSDFPSPHGFVLNRSPQPIDAVSVTKNKTKLIAWFVSNCHSESGRESLARTLQQFVDVDTFGRCGPLECLRARQSECYAMLERDYKFYLAFENSLCSDYVTEKFFGVLQYYVVPVVWGSADYLKQGPRHSYVDARDFADVASLARYLKYLDANHTAYMEYFSWKSDQQLATGWSASAKPWCDLCERLHSDPAPKYYDDLQAWFVNGSSCESPLSRDLARFIHGETVTLRF